jgi:hypothetical protein
MVAPLALAHLRFGIDQNVAGLETGVPRDTHRPAARVRQPLPGLC